LTRETGGGFFVVKNVPQMIVTVQQIEQELRNGYELVFRADKTRSGMRRMGILSTHKAWRLYYRAAYYQPPPSTTGTIQIAAR
jgi:hypothetical protein